jgi:hypothetical protein
MNRQHLRESLGDDMRNELELEMDLQVAARSRVPVLISASPRCALTLTQAIAGRLSSADRHIRIRTYDVAECDDLEAALTTPPLGHAHEPRGSILLLREVHALTPTGQAVLRRLISARGLETPRVFASSSISLFQCVNEGRFDAELFYCLNAVHIRD